MAKQARRTLDRALGLTRAGDSAGAEAELKRVLQVEPANASAWTLYAQLLDQRGELDRAERAYVRAIEIDQSAFTARVNLGVLLERRGDAHAAVAQYEVALVQRPDDGHALRNFGGILRRVGQMDRALEVLTKAARIVPNDAGAHANLGLTLSALGRHDEALAHLDESVRLSPTDERMHHARLLTMHYASRVTPEATAAAHREYGAMLEQALPAFTPEQRSVAPHEPLRIGFVSADFRRHSVAFFLEPLLAHLSPADFTVYAYSGVREPDEFTVRLREHIAEYREVASLSDDECAKLIRHDRIDVLVDLNGHTSNNRLAVFARKPAPVQITYLGYPDTTGLTRMDYRLTDEASDPSGTTEQLHTERLLRLPGGFLCYQPPKPSPQVAACPSDVTGQVTFGSFNALTKMSDKVLELWSRLLVAVPNSRLLVKQLVLSSASGRAHFEQRLRAFDIPLERVELLGNIADMSSHLAAYGRVDIALDAFPYHGTTTTCDALWMGVPVITLAGRAHVSRVGVGLLARARLSDLVAHDEDAYVELARALAADPERRRTLRAALRQRMSESTLLDGARIAQEFTAVVRTAYQAHAAELDARRGPERLSVRPANDQARAAHSEPPPAKHGVPLPDSEARWYSLPGGLVAAGPSSSEVFEGYVLAEQGDWYEGEVRFVRNLMRAGERALDLGSGAGVYALSMAERVGPSGAVGACSDLTLELSRLRASAQANQLDHLHVAESVAGLRTSGLCALVRVSPSEVPEFDVDAIAALCAAGDPVVMIEVARLPERAEPLISALLGGGRALYRYIPGLGALFPHPPGTETDPLLTNLFLLSPARADELAQRELLARFTEHIELPVDLSLAELSAAVAAMRDVDVRGAFRDATGSKAAHRDALLHFAAKRRKGMPLAARAYALRTALRSALAAIDDPTDVARLSTLARLAADWGRRAIAVEACDTALTIHSAGNGRLAEPFLPAVARYDAIAPGTRLSELAISALLEQREQAGAYSSFFTRDDADCLGRLDLIQKLGFQNLEMARRLSLVRKHQSQP